MTQFFLLRPGINPLSVCSFRFHWVKQTVQESTWGHQLPFKIQAIYTHTCAHETQQSETDRTAVHYNGWLTWSFSWWRFSEIMRTMKIRQSRPCFILCFIFTWKAQRNCKQISSGRASVFCDNVAIMQPASLNMLMTDQLSLITNCSSSLFRFQY